MTDLEQDPSSLSPPSPPTESCLDLVHTAGFSQTLPCFAFLVNQGSYFCLEALQKRLQPRRHCICLQAYPLANQGPSSSLWPSTRILRWPQHSLTNTCSEPRAEPGRSCPLGSPACGISLLRRAAVPHWREGLQRDCQSSGDLSSGSAPTVCEQPQACLRSYLHGP